MKEYKHLIKFLSLNDTIHDYCESTRIKSSVYKYDIETFQHIILGLLKKDFDEIKHVSEFKIRKTYENIYETNIWNKTIKNPEVNIEAIIYKYLKDINFLKKKDNENKSIQPENYIEINIEKIKQNIIDFNFATIRYNKNVTLNDTNFNNTKINTYNIIKSINTNNLTFILDANPLPNYKQFFCILPRDLGIEHYTIYNGLFTLYDAGSTLITQNTVGGGTIEPKLKIYTSNSNNSNENNNSSNNSQKSQKNLSKNNSKEKLYNNSKNKINLIDLKCYEDEKYSYSLKKNENELIYVEEFGVKYFPLRKKHELYRKINGKDKRLLLDTNQNRTLALGSFIKLISLLENTLKKDTDKREHTIDFFKTFIEEIALKELCKIFQIQFFEKEFKITNTKKKFGLDIINKTLSKDEKEEMKILVRNRTIENNIISYFEYKRIIAENSNNNDEYAYYDNLLDSIDLLSNNLEYDFKNYQYVDCRNFCRCLIDFKRAMDYLQVKACKVFNEINSNKDCVFVTQDRPAVLFSILNNCPTIKVVQTNNRTNIELELCNFKKNIDFESLTDQFYNVPNISQLTIFDEPNIQQSSSNNGAEETEQNDFSYNSGNEQINIYLREINAMLDQYIIKIIKKQKSIQGNEEKIIATVIKYFKDTVRTKYRNIIIRNFEGNNRINLRKKIDIEFMKILNNEIINIPQKVLNKIQQSGGKYSYAQNSYAQDSYNSVFIPKSTSKKYIQSKSVTGKTASLTNLESQNSINARNNLSRNSQISENNVQQSRTLKSQLNFKNIPELSQDIFNNVQVDMLQILFKKEVLFSKFLQLYKELFGNEMSIFMYISYHTIFFIIDKKYNPDRNIKNFDQLYKKISNISSNLS